MVLHQNMINLNRGKDIDSDEIMNNEQRGYYGLRKRNEEKMNKLSRRRVTALFCSVRRISGSTHE